MEPTSGCLAGRQDGFFLLKLITGFLLRLFGFHDGRVGWKTSLSNQIPELHSKDGISFALSQTDKLNEMVLEHYWGSAFWRITSSPAKAP
jgi:hypothetical protein